MIRIFVSSERVDVEPAATLIKRLRSEGWFVNHSPSNPLDKEDPRWRNWYKVNLLKELDDSDIFIIVLTKTWESTWMAEESHQAMETLFRKHVPHVYYWNPANIQQASNLTIYLRERLPDGIEELVAKLKEIKD